MANNNRCSCVECSKIEPFDLKIQPKPAPVPIHVGTMRLHFNRHGAAPLVWTVAVIDDAGAVLWELSVAGISCAAQFGSRYVTKATADDDDGKPSAWFEVDGQLTILTDGGFSCARITP